MDWDEDGRWEVQRTRCEVAVRKGWRKAMKAGHTEAMEVMVQLASVPWTFESLHLRDNNRCFSDVIGKKS